MRVEIHCSNGERLALDVDDGFFVEEDSTIFPYQIKVQDGTITELS